MFVFIKETREGWPLLTVKTEVNGDSNRTNGRGPSWLFHYPCRPVQEILSCLGCSSRPSTKYFSSSPDTISLHLFSSSSKLSRQSCWVACLLICVSGFFLGFSYFQLLQNQMCKQTCQQYKYTVYSIHMYNK